jgi:hypothetical protein
MMILSATSVIWMVISWLSLGRVRVCRLLLILHLIFLFKNLLLTLIIQPYQSFLPIASLGLPLFSPSSNMQALHSSLDETKPHYLHCILVGMVTFAVSILIDSAEWIMSMIMEGRTFSKSLMSSRTWPR